MTKYNPNDNVFVMMDDNEIIRVKVLDEIENGVYQVSEYDPLTDSIIIGEIYEDDDNHWLAK